jgi:hypothetical protein
MHATAAISAPCPGCQQPLRHVVLEGHYAKAVQVDLCTACHLVWFDAFESVRLSGLGWVQLLRAMLWQPVSHAVFSSKMACARCHDPLVEVHNQTRFGHSAAMECRQGHGQLQTFTLLLAERGLLRAVLPVDRSSLAKEGRVLQCLQCGAGDHAPSAKECAYCTSPLLVVDVPRLASALLMRHGDALRLKPNTNPLALACRGCGHALNPAEHTLCSRCGHGVTWSELDSMRPLLDAVEPLLLAQQPREARPWGTRLRERQGDPKETQFYRFMKHANLMQPHQEGESSQPVGRAVWQIFFLVLVVLFTVVTCRG